MDKFCLPLMLTSAMALWSHSTCAEETYGPVVAPQGNGETVIEGEAFAVNGGTISIRLQPVRLHGIQALEHGESCGDGWMGRDEAMELLAKLIAGQIVTCLVHGQDRSHQPIATCSVGNTDLNEAMVLNGVALADTLSTRAYQRTEQTAEALGAGYHKPGRHCGPPWRRAKDYPS